ncbi:MAG TPA: hypothetical protein VGY58_20530 [Gemmataceae bacterium]|nr:hypothetical protein [Gemmataceae bacterium]
MQILRDQSGGTIVLDQPAPFPEGTRVEITIQERPKAASALGQALMKLAGTAVGLRQDMAAQHDHYLHGT